MNLIKSKLTDLYKIYESSTGISINSKKVKEGNIFFGIEGQNFNGSDFAQEAIDNGACKAVVLPQSRFESKYNDKIFLSNSPILDLQNLAKFHRKKFKIPFIGITGSVGKTTTRELVKTILSTKYKVHSNLQNFNTEIGVPITILTIPKDSEIAVIEMGARLPGDIKFLCDMVQPTHGLITNIAEVHLDTLKNLQGIVKVKKELYDYLDKNSKFKFVNFDLELLKKKLDEKNRENTIYYGSHGYSVTKSCNSELQTTYIDEFDNIIDTNLLGSYNNFNISAARCVGKYFGIDNDTINNTIKNFQSYNNRQQLIHKESNSFILDAYSSNFDSLSKILNVFCKFKSKKKKWSS